MHERARVPDVASARSQPFGPAGTATHLLHPATRGKAESPRGDTYLEMSPPPPKPLREQCWVELLLAMGSEKGLHVLSPVLCCAPARRARLPRRVCVQLQLHLPVLQGAEGAGGCLLEEHPLCKAQISLGKCPDPKAATTTGQDLRRSTQRSRPIHIKTSFFVRVHLFGSFPGAPPAAVGHFSALGYQKSNISRNETGRRRASSCGSRRARPPPGASCPLFASGSKAPGWDRLFRVGTG